MGQPIASRMRRAITSRRRQARSLPAAMIGIIILGVIALGIIVLAGDVSAEHVGTSFAVAAYPPAQYNQQVAYNTGYNAAYQQATGYQTAGNPLRSYLTDGSQPPGILSFGYVDRPQYRPQYARQSSAYNPDIAYRQRYSQVAPGEYGYPYGHYQSYGDYQYGSQEYGSQEYGSQEYGSQEYGYQDSLWYGGQNVPYATPQPSDGYFWAYPGAEDYLHQHNLYNQPVPGAQYPAHAGYYW